MEKDLEREFIEMVKKLPLEKQIEFYFMVKGAVFTANKSVE